MKKLPRRLAPLLTSQSPLRWSQLRGQLGSIDEFQANLVSDYAWDSAGETQPLSVHRWSIRLFQLSYWQEYIVFN